MIGRVLIAYLLWLFLGGLGAHRFFLGRTGSGLTMLAMTLLGCGWCIVILLLAVDDIRQLEDPVLIGQLGRSSAMLPAAAILMFVTLWWLVDLLLVACMVLKDAEQARDTGHDEAAFKVHAANLDPSFQATRRMVGIGTDTRRGSALPEGYVLPWRREDGKSPPQTYKPGEE